MYSTTTSSKKYLKKTSNQRWNCLNFDLKIVYSSRQKRCFPQFFCVSTTNEFFRPSILWNQAAPMYTFQNIVVKWSTRKLNTKRIEIVNDNFPNIFILLIKFSIFFEILKYEVKRYGFVVLISNTNTPDCNHIYYWKAC